MFISTDPRVINVFSSDPNPFLYLAFNLEIPILKMDEICEIIPSQKGNDKINVSTAAGPSKTSADKQKQQYLPHTGAREGPIILGKIPEDNDIEEKDVPVEEQFILRLMVSEDVKQKFREKVKSGKFTDDMGIIFKGN